MLINCVTSSLSVLCSVTTSKVDNIQLTKNTLSLIRQILVVVNSHDPTLL